MLHIHLNYPARSVHISYQAYMYNTIEHAFNKRTNNQVLDTVAAWLSDLYLELDQDCWIVAKTIKALIWHTWEPQYIALKYIWNIWPKFEHLNFCLGVRRNFWWNLQAGSKTRYNEGWNQAWRFVFHPIQSFSWSFCDLGKYKLLWIVVLWPCDTIVCENMMWIWKDWDAKLSVLQLLLTATCSARSTLYP